jgi:hypothetical protein
MLEKKIFVPNLDFYLINKSIAKVINMLTGQAELQKIDLKFRGLKEDMLLKMDELRI